MSSDFVMFALNFFFQYTPLSLLLISSVLVVFIYVFNRSENIVWFVFGQIFPATAMLLFIFIPFDLVTASLWAIAFGVFMYSFCRLIWRLWLLVRQKFSRKPINLKPWKFYIRPALCCLFFLVAQSMQTLSKASANEKALNLAFAMQEQVVKTRSCLSENTLGDKGILYGDFGTQYWITFWCDQALEKFSYTVRLNRDVDFIIWGDFSGNLKVEYGHYAARQIVELNNETNIDDLFKMKSDVR